MRSFEINGTIVLVAKDWHISDVINSRSVFDGTIVDELSLSAVLTGQELKVYTDELLGNARDIGDGTFSRTSNATMQDGTGVTANVTRYETGQFGQAVMIEEGTTNICPQPTAVGDSLWTKETFVGTIDLNDALAPDGNTTASHINRTSGYVYYAKADCVVGTSYTFSIWLKSATGANQNNDISIYCYNTARRVTCSDISVTSSWKRFAVTFTCEATEIALAFTIFNSYSTDVYVWGAQIEAKSYVTSFIETTRAAETLTIPTAGVLSADEGTVEFFFKPLSGFFDSNVGGDGFNRIIGHSSNINTNELQLCNEASSDKLLFAISNSGGEWAGGSAYSCISTTVLALDTWYHIAARWSQTAGTFSIFVNGVKEDEATYDKFPTISNPLYIGSHQQVVERKGNILIDDLRISNIARDDAEILDSYSTGAALPVDAYTTAKLAFDQTLEIFARPVIFAGTIDAPEAVESDPGYLYYPITAVDYNQIADKRLYAASHESTLAGNIVSAIISAKLSEEGITAGSIEDGPVIAKANFNYKKCSESLDYLKDVTGMNWNIDSEKQLNFFSNSTNLAPWILSDSVQHANFRVKRNRSQYRNVQYVRAGTGKTTEQSLEKPSPAPDGSSKSFILRFPVAEKPVVYVNSTAVLSANVGVNGLDVNKSWYFSYNSNIISQDSSTAVLTSGATLEITYTGLYPILPRIDDPAQIAERAAIETGTSGIYENLQTEKSINERNQAFEYAEGLILKYGIIPSVVTFDTEVPGLKAGQLLPIQKTLFGINSSFLIESVDISAADAGKINYSVKCLDGSAIGGWERFFVDLIGKTKEYVISENEVIALLNVQTETLDIGSSTTINIYNPLNYGTSWSLIQQLDSEFAVYSLVYLGSGVVLAGTGAGGKIYKSTDSGDSWSLIGQLGAADNVEALVYLGNGVVLAGTTSTGQVYKSTDSGDSWSLIQQLGSDTYLTSLCYLDSGIVLAGMTSGLGNIYKSTDYGDSWSLIGRLDSETRVYSLCSLGSGVVLAGTYPHGYVYKSTDSGDSWSLIQRLGSEYHAYSLVYLGNGVVLAGTAASGQIYKSTDSGDSWSYVQDLGSEVYLTFLCYLSSGIVLAGCYDTGNIYKSTDSGDSWSLVQQLGSEDFIHCLAYLGNGVVLAGTSATGQIYKSTTTPTSTEVVYD